MAYLMGVDLGTSSVKALLVDAGGKQMGVAGEKYGISIPRPKWAEQDPLEWWEKTVLAIRRVLADSAVNPGDITALSFSAQMHGLVAVDSGGKPVRPAIIWPDQRTSGTIAEIYEKLGRDYVGKSTLNAIATGFLLASLYWLKRHEPESYRRTRRVMLPKDYIKFRLSGTICTDPSDAAASLAFDNTRLVWAEEMLNRLELDVEKFPPILPSTGVLGPVSPGATAETGLSVATRVVNGGVDQAMQAIGNGIVEDGVFSANIGTGGQVSTSMARPVYDPLLRTSTFAHALPGRWYIMGAVLASGLSLRWLADNVLGGADFAGLGREAAAIPPGGGGLIFLPYLSGERTPHLDPDARAVFFGLTLGHTRAHMARAVMEGVVYTFRDCLEILTGLGLPCRKLIASGGGASSEVWLQIQADILGHDIHRSLVREQACLGAAITAGVGVGVYSGFAEACAGLVRFDPVVYHPREENVRIHNRGYAIFRELYQANKAIFKELDTIAAV